MMEQSTLLESPQMIQTERSPGMPEGHAATQWDLNRVKKWADRNVITFIKE